MKNFLILIIIIKSINEKIINIMIYDNNNNENKNKIFILDDQLVDIDNNKINKIEIKKNY